MKIQRSSLLATAILLGLGLTNVAQATQEPNFYECTGKNASLILSIGSKAEIGISPAQTLLNLQVGQKNYTFQEQEIMTESTLIGDLWEVTLDHIPDQQIDHASVVIPSINLGESPVRFKSQLILTRLSTPFTGKPLEGVVNASKYIDLFCTASVVYY